MDKYYNTKKSKASKFYWIPDRDAILDHYCSKMIKQFNRQQQIEQSDIRQRQKEIHRELLDIKASKGKHGKEYVNKHRNIRKEGTDTFQDMINKFKEKRKEQTLMENLLRKRRESLTKVNKDMQERSSSKIWDIVGESRSDTFRVNNARNASDNIVDDMRRFLYNARHETKETLADDILSFLKHQDKSKSEVTKSENKHSTSNVSEKRRPSINRNNFVRERKHSEPEPRLGLDRRISVEDLNIGKKNKSHVTSKIYRSRKNSKNTHDREKCLLREGPLELGDLIKLNETKGNKNMINNDSQDKGLKDVNNIGVRKRYQKHGGIVDVTNEQAKADDTQKEIEREYSMSFELSSASGKSTPTAGNWEKVKQCKYLRGYDPPEMVMPKETVNVFVFGRDENDIINLKWAEEERSISPTSAWLAPGKL